MRVVAVAWLVAWAAIGFPWRSITDTPSLERVRLVPFRDGRALSQALNVAAFLPCGVIGVALGWSVGRATLAGAGISAATELAQLFSTRRYPSTTDLILNSFGSGMGAALATVFRRRYVRSV
jgi:glycopeptide antibiotics resistance protein